MKDIELRDYQKVGVDFLYDRKSAGCFDEMGVGKSRQAIAVINRIGSTQNLMVTPKIVARHWTREIGKVFGTTYTQFISSSEESMEAFHHGEAGAFIALGSPLQRSDAVIMYQLFKTKFPNRPSFLITNYHNQLDLLKVYPSWSVRILDEAHNIKNHKTKLWEATREFTVLRDYLLTGTPMSQGPKDLWAYLNIFDPKEFGGYWPFINEHLHCDRSTTYGTWIGGPKYPKQFKDLMENYVIRRLKKDVLPELEKSRIKYDVTPNSKQQKIYNDLAVESLAETDAGDLLLIENGAVKTIRHRQLLVAPQILGFDFGSATLEATHEIVTTCGTPSVIFTTFREAFPYIRNCLPKNWEIYEVAGGMSYEALDDVVQTYEHSSTTNKTLIATTQMSSGYEVLCASNAIFAGLDWSPTFNFQSEDRLSRLGNHNHVTCHYIINTETVEDGMVKRVTEKVEWAEQSIRPRRIHAN